ncbi:MAG: pyridoxamine 5'-phosphate oxidase family protein [Clostridium sp.]|nr:pyridoxamine 5'-phosphate oxidase family protein [Clostridium sp.]
MFREMRRKRQLLSKAETEEILNSCTSGVLAVIGDEGYPYTVPLSYVYTDGKIYFHCAKSGHKLDAVQGCDKVSFCVISKDDILAEKFTTKYKSVVVFGKIKVLKTIEEMEQPIRILTRKYVKDNENGITQEFEGAKNNMYMLELSIEHMTGKQCIELVPQGK